MLALVVALPYHVVHTWPMLSPTGFSGSADRVVGELQALPEGALAISDDPGIVWRAGRRTTPDLVDASILRIQTGDLTSASVAAVAAEDDVCAVVVRSAAALGLLRRLPGATGDRRLRGRRRGRPRPPPLPQVRLPSRLIRPEHLRSLWS